MITKKDLESLRELQSRKEALENRRERLRESVRRYAAPLSDMPHAPAWKDTMAEYVSEMDHLDHEITKLIIAIEERILRVEKEIDCLPTNMQTIIRMRYEQCFGWKKIMRKTHYSERNVFKLHSRALKMLKGEKSAEKCSESER